MIGGADKGKTLCHLLLREHLGSVIAWTMHGSMTPLFHKGLLLLILREKGGCAPKWDIQGDTIKDISNILFPLKTLLLYLTLQHLLHYIMEEK